MPSVHLLADAFPVLSQTFVLELAAGLHAAGVPLHILTTGVENAEPALLQGHPAGADLAERLVPPHASAAAVARFLGGRTLQGRPPLHLLARAALRPHRGLSLLRRATAFAQCPDADILHCQFATLGSLALRLRAWDVLRFRRLVVHLRGWDVTMHAARHGPGALRDVFDRGDLFIAVCRHLADRAVGLGCDPARIVVIGSPIDTGRFQPPAVPREPSPTLRIGAVGRLVEKKGFDDLVAAMARLQTMGVGATLDIIGEGPMRAPLEERIGRAGLHDTVRLHGAAPPAEVLALLQRIDLAIAPSVRAASGDEEGIVNSLKEAMATGLPVIGTRHGGIPELVDHGTNGFLVPERDPDALAAAIRDMAALAPDERAALGRAGRRKVVSEYSPSVIVARTIEAYRRVLDMPGAGYDAAVVRTAGLEPARPYDREIFVPSTAFTAGARAPFGVWTIPSPSPLARP